MHQILVLGLLHGDVAFGGAQHATTDRAAVAYGVADYHYCLTEQIGRNVVEIDEWEIGLRIDFDECQIGLVVAGNVMSAVSLAIVCGDVNLQVRRPLDYVLVRYDIPGRIDDETRAETLQGLTDFARPNPIVAEELRIEIVNRVAHGASNDTLRIDIHHRR